MSDARSDRGSDESGPAGSRPHGDSNDERDPWSAIEGMDVTALLELPTSVHDALAAQPRKHVIAHLLGRDRPTAVADLAVVVAASRDEKSPASVTPDQRMRVAVELRHVHLPKLADYGFVEWDRDEGTVGLTDE